MTKSKKPHGRDQVKAAILKAAEELFSQHGPAAVSIRDIAAQANVNHGLVHRHFKSKENLRRQVQDNLSRKIREEIGEPVDYEEGLWNSIQALRTQDAFWRVLARTFLDGQYEGDVQSDFPFIRRMVEAVEQGQKEGRLNQDIDPRVIVAGGVAMSLGLMVFEGYILPGTGLDKEPASQMNEKIIGALFSILNS